MKLNKENKKILKTFSNINEQVVITKGIVGVTDAEKNIGCYYKWDVDVVEPFVVPNIGEFLNLIDLYEDPTITKTNRYINIKEGKQKNVLTCLDDKIAKSIKPIDRDKFIENIVNKRQVEQEVNLTASQLSSIKKNVSILKNTHIKLKDNLITTYDKMINSESSSENTYTLELDGVNGINEKVIKSDYFIKIIEDDYKISIYDAFLFLKASNNDVEYMFKLVAV